MAPTAISLFSGAGGMDYGFEAAGFDTRAVLEFDQACCQTLRKNISGAVLEGDIHEISVAEILRTAKLRQSAVDLLYGGPPCQPFSKAAYWNSGDTKRLNDPRASTLSAFMRVVEEALPAVFVLENVHGISYSGKEEGLQLLFDRIQEINRQCKVNYTPAWKVLNAADFGVPQIRKRFFLVACRDGVEFKFPRAEFGPTDGDQLFQNMDLLPHRTAWDAIGDLPDVWPGEDLRLRGRWAELLPSIPEGENYLWHTNRKGGMPLFGWRTRYWSFLLKLSKRLPSWTIQAQPGPAIGPFHWKSRMLSMRELCRLQTFPDEVRIIGSRRQVQSQLGNAVPSLLAEVLGREIINQVFGASGWSELKLRPPKREPVPRAERVKRVPVRFLDLAGDHDDHPGTGLGRSASRRGEVEFLAPPKR